MKMISSLLFFLSRQSRHIFKNQCLNKKNTSLRCEQISYYLYAVSCASTHFVDKYIEETEQKLNKQNKGTKKMRIEAHSRITSAPYLYWFLYVFGVDFLVHFGGMRIEPFNSFKSK